MEVTREEARRIATLAHLEFDEPGLDRIAAELTKILQYVDQLHDVPTSEEAATRAPVRPTPLRDDVPQPTLDREEAARNAPSWSDGFFVVARVIGGET
jgi:aspartyl-tRNA(Asn)/glutamyl-tRNA(Gln) amidotransferase subunit C